jgi:predicted metal-dependent hydrolase
VPKTARPQNLPLFTEEELSERLPIILSGIEQFNDGFFFEAHEIWEDVWLQSPMPARRFLQGLIQTAAAFVHLARHEYPGTVRLLGHAIAKLEAAPGTYLGIDAAALAAEARRCREELLALGPDAFEAWDRARIPAIQVVTPP